MLKEARQRIPYIERRHFDGGTTEKSVATNWLLI